MKKKAIVMITTLTSLTFNLSAATCWEDKGDSKQLVDCSAGQQVPQPIMDKQPLSLPPPQNGGHQTPWWCSNPNKTRLEELICSSPILSELDMKFNQLYKKLPPDSRPTGLAQDRDKKCDDEKKLKSWYESAIQALSASSQFSYPSFPSLMVWCTKPFLSEPERVMCSLSEKNSDLVELDSKLNDLYRSIEKKNIDEQRKWLRSRDAILLSRDVNRVKEIYEERIRQLTSQ
jgi:uncharacterized protein